MAKNIVVLKLYKMPDRTEQNFKFKFDSDTYHTYKKLLDLAVSQAEQHIQDIDELIVHERTADNDQDMFKKHMLELEELYKSGDHNVLSIGNDVIYFESTNPFDPAYSRFTLSGLNADVKYFPAGGVSDAVWNYQKQEIGKWEQLLELAPYNMRTLYEPGNPIKWNAEQTIYQNMMYRSIQEKYPEYEPNTVHIPENMTGVAQYTSIAHGDWHNTDTAIHFHASRNPEKILNIVTEAITKHKQDSELHATHRMQRICEWCQQQWWLHIEQTEGQEDNVKPAAPEK